MNDVNPTGEDQRHSLSGVEQQNFATFDTLARAFRARNLVTALEGAVVFDSAQSAAHARRVLEANDFDYAPVIDGHAVTGIFDRLAASDRPELSVGDVRHPLDAKHIISGDAPLLETLRWLVDQPFLFVLDGRAISGFVTRSDVDKQPGRLFFFLRIVEFEQGLAGLVREHYPEQRDALELLAETDGRDRVQERYALNREANRALDLVAYMELSQLVRITRKTPALYETLGFASGGAWDKATSSLIALRHNVMHPARSLENPEFPLPKLIAVLDRLEKLLDRLR